MSLLSIKDKIRLPPDWRIEPIGKVLLSSQYGTSNSSSETGVPVIGMKNLQDGKVNFNDLPFVSLNEDEKAKLLLHSGDILLNRTNSYDLVGKVGYVKKACEAVFASYLVRLEVDKTKSDPKFVAMWLSSYWADMMIKKIATRAVSQANVNPTEFKKFCLIPILPLPEQKNIADLLSTWDEAIEKIEQLTKAKKKRFKGLISNLICSPVFKRGHIRDITKEVSVRNKWKKISRVLSVTNHSGFVLPEEQFARSVASSNLSNYKVVTHGEYAYNPSRINVGSIARLNNWNEGVLSPMYVVFSIDVSKTHSDFFLHWLSSHEAKQRIAKSAQGSVRETVSFSGLGSIPFPMPNLLQQKEIAETLSFAQQEIDLLKQLAEKYKTQKRGLMQKLLIGAWRVNEKSLTNTRRRNHD